MQKDELLKLAERWRRRIATVQLLAAMMGGAVVLDRAKIRALGPLAGGE